MYFMEKDDNNMKRAALVILLTSSIIFSGCDGGYERLDNAEVTKIEQSSVRGEYAITLKKDNEEMKFAVNESRVRMVEVGNKIDVLYSSRYMEIRRLDYSKKGGK